MKKYRTEDNMKLKEIQFYNRAPFKELHIGFGESKVNVLAGINGAGKTTIISYIVDAIYEFAKHGFRVEFEEIQGKFYRVSSMLSVLDKERTSLVYFRFEEKGKEFDYIDIRNVNSEEEYISVVKVKNPIPYSKIKEKIRDEVALKYFTLLEKKELTDLFNGNILTYFPAYRYEQPGYLNDPYNITLSFKKQSDFAGYLMNPIEVTSNLQDVANWIMDIVLDSELYKGTAQLTFRQLSSIFTELLRAKVHEPVRLGVGPRYAGAARIQIVRISDTAVIYPSIFEMSSGELSLICMFCELIRQADRLRNSFDKVSGIVLIDEIDKHLHIKLQKETLPRLIKLFPNVQFIVTSHSPFFNLGLAEESKDLYSIFDLDNGGVCSTPYCNDLFKEVYDIFIDENEQFAQKYDTILNELKNSQVPLVITEGKTDWKHLKAAKDALGIDDFEIEICEYEENMGDKNLLSLLKRFAISSPQRKIIGMFDRDDEDICKEINADCELYIELSKNIYAFSIPVANESTYGIYTSIEHYYTKENLLKEKENRRLYLGEEFYESGIGRCKTKVTKCKNIQHKVRVNGIIDEKVYLLSDDPEQKKSVALPKDDFAQLILDKTEFANGFDFSEFHKIFDVIRKIVKL